MSDETKLNRFFSINAGESKYKNEWTREFLKYEEHRQCLNPESIIIDRQYKIFLQFEQYLSSSFLDPIVNQTSENHFGSEIKFSPNQFKLLGVFSTDENRPRIIYYEGFDESYEAIKFIVRIHERMHAFHYLNWPISSIDYNQTSIVYHEFLAQLFTFNCIKDTYLETHFLEFSKRQPHIYQTWKIASKFSKTQVLQTFLSIANGLSSKIPQLDVLAKEYYEAGIDHSLLGIADDLWG